MFPPVGEVIDTCIEHSMWDVGEDGHIVEDMWFEALECIGSGQHMKEVVFFPLCIPIEFFKFGQIFGKICHSFMGSTEVLYFS